MIFSSLKGNTKLGKGVATTTLPILTTCPSTCAHHPTKAGTCYANLGAMRFNQSYLMKRNPTPTGVVKQELFFLSSLPSGTLTRLHVAGDFISQSHLTQAATLSHKRGLKAWSYTHRWRSLKPRQGISLLASVENTDDMRKAHARGFAVARVVSHHQTDKAHPLYDSAGRPTGFVGIPCPEQTRGIKCEDCQLCLKADYLHSSRSVILFAAHGAKKASIFNILK
jgi:hypothetical protein